MVRYICILVRWDGSIDWPTSLVQTEISEIAVYS